MPNTLAHLGAQGITTGFVQKIDPRWLALGCVIPDLPWILQRIMAQVAGIDLLDLRLYVVVQASLLFCVLLSFAIALIAEKVMAVFLILSSQSALHLILDALQKKTANGVHLFVPFSWQMTNIGWFWPESPVTLVLTISGAGYVLYHFRSSMKAPLGFARMSRVRWISLAAVVVLYFVLPVAWMPQAEAANNHFVHTLRAHDSRAGQPIEFDRATFVPSAQDSLLLPFTGEKLTASGIALDESATVSITGEFVSSEHIRVLTYHRHQAGVRDAASYVGLAVIGVWWFFGLRAERRQRNQSQRNQE